MSYLTYEEVSAQRSNRTSPQAPDSSVDPDSDSNLSVLLLWVVSAQIQGTL